MIFTTQKCNNQCHAHSSIKFNSTRKLEKRGCWLFLKFMFDAYSLDLAPLDRESIERLDRRYFDGKRPGNDGFRVKLQGRSIWYVN